MQNHSSSPAAVHRVNEGGVGWAPQFCCMARFFCSRSAVCCHCTQINSHTPTASIFNDRHNLVLIIVTSLSKIIMLFVLSLLHKHILRPKEVRARTGIKRAAESSIHLHVGVGQKYGLRTLTINEDSMREAIIRDRRHVTFNSSLKLSTF